VPGRSLKNTDIAPPLSFTPHHGQLRCLWQFRTLESGTVKLVLADPGFDEKYERDYNIFNPANRYDPGNPVNPANQYSPDNPFNPANQYNPQNPLNPANRYNPNTPFEPLNRTR